MNIQWILPLQSMGTDSNSLRSVAVLTCQASCHFSTQSGFWMNFTLFLLSLLVYVEYILSCSLNLRSEMEGRLQAHDWPFRGVAAPSWCISDCWKSRFWVVEIARLPALIFGRRKALYFTGDTTKSSSCISQSCVVGAQTDGIPLYLLYFPDVFSFSLNIFLERTRPTLSCFSFCYSELLGKIASIFKS